MGIPPSERHHVSPFIQTEHISGDGPPAPRKYKVKSSGETGTALGVGASPNATHRQMSDGKQRVNVVSLLMEGTGEVRMFVDDAIESLDGPR